MQGSYCLKDIILSKLMPIELFLELIIPDKDLTLLVTLIKVMTTLTLAISMIYQR
jgi:hypothetical protein